ncbi:hypothetical protein CPC16_002302 [Podila verticillata]|nr:hypothetical protein CPC16_002302 [Podila verticillata]KAI9236032.1 MAG: hypothetical protein BYD32DRAFT_437814 [Podila humilis]
MSRCKVCNRVYKNKDSLKSHYYDTHDGKMERVTRIECPLESCTASFKTKSGFKNHCKRHANEWEHQRQSTPASDARQDDDEDAGLTRAHTWHGSTEADNHLGTILNPTYELGQFHSASLDTNELIWDEAEDDPDPQGPCSPSNIKSEVRRDIFTRQHPSRNRESSTFDAEVNFVRTRLAEFSESFTPTNDVAINEYFSSICGRDIPRGTPSSQDGPMTTSLEGRSKSISPPPTPDTFQCQEPPCIETMLNEVRRRLRVPTDPELGVIYNILFQDDFD